MEMIQIPQKVKDDVMDLVDRTDEEEIHIVLTDVTFHSTKPCHPASFVRGVQKTITNGLPGRTYYSNSIHRSDAGSITVQLPMLDSMQEIVEKAKAKGKLVRFFFHKDGIPMLLGKDAQEKIAALKRKGEL
jgi:hypothetical protein